MSQRVHAPEQSQWQVNYRYWLPAGLVLVLLLWAYYPTLAVFAHKWLHDPQYSHGPLVPLFAAYLLWRSRQQLPRTPTPVLGAGLLLVGVAGGLRWLAGQLLFYQLDALSLLLVLAGLGLLAGGWPLLRWAAPAIGFLVFMIPLPYELERNVGQPLKAAATIGSTFLLQTLGFPALREGNLIVIDEVRLGVVDACSGLKMLMTFAAFSVGAALLIKRTRLEKALIICGIVPIAVLANILRIAATGISHVYVRDPQVLEFLHDFHGWLMMPIGLVLLGVELWVLRNLVVVEEPPPDAGGVDWLRR